MTEGAVDWSCRHVPLIPNPGRMRTRRMRFTGLLLLVGFIAVGAAPSAHDRDIRIARQLSSEKTRKAAVAEVVSAKGLFLPRLIEWTEAPPSGVNSYDLATGLADCFAELRTNRAIPFLVKNIAIERSASSSPSTFSPESMKRSSYSLFNSGSARLGKSRPGSFFWPCDGLLGREAAGPRWACNLVCDRGDRRREN